MLEFGREVDYFKVYPNLERGDFLGLMNMCHAMVGNSSTGLIELPLFGKPFVCKETRQTGRLAPSNTLRVGYGREEIRNALDKALHDDKFRSSLTTAEKRYLGGEASARIAGFVQSWPMEKDQ